MKKRIKLMLILLFLTAITLSTATYSWFSTNRTVYVSELNIKVQAQGGIEISADAKSWKPMITHENILNANKTYPNSVNQIPNTMEPVSTGKNVKDGKLQMYYGYVENKNDNYILAAKKDVEKEGTEEGKFMAFDVFLKTDNDTKLFLDRASGATYSGITPGIQNAVRFAFLVEGNISSKTDYTTAQNLNRANEETTYIWEPNYDTHSKTGIQNALNVYGLEVFETDSQRISYDGIINEISKNDSVFIEKANADKYPNFFKKVNIDYFTKKQNEDNIEIFPLKSGITKIRIYIWIEGQDVDCENKAAIGNIIFNFQFTTNPS